MWRPLSFPSPDKLKIFSRIFFTPRLCKNISQLRSAKRISIFYTFSYSGCSAVELLISRKGWKGKIKKMKLEEKTCLVDYSAKGSSINSDADHHSDILKKKFKMSQKSSISWINVWKGTHCTWVSPSVYSWVASKGSIHTTIRSCSMSPPRILVCNWTLQPTAIKIFGNSHVFSKWCIIKTRKGDRSVVFFELLRNNPQPREGFPHAVVHHPVLPKMCHRWKDGYHLWESMSPSVTGSLAPSNVCPLLRSPMSAWLLVKWAFYSLI